MLAIRDLIRDMKRLQVLDKFFASGTFKKMDSRLGVKSHVPPAVEINHLLLGKMCHFFA